MFAKKSRSLASGGPTLTIVAQRVTRPGSSAAAARAYGPPARDAHHGELRQTQMIGDGLDVTGGVGHPVLPLPAGLAVSGPVVGHRTDGMPLVFAVDRAQQAAPRRPVQEEQWRAVRIPPLTERQSPTIRSTNDLGFSHSPPGTPGHPDDDSVWQRTVAAEPRKQRIRCRSPGFSPTCRNNWSGAERLNQERPARGDADDRNPTASCHRWPATTTTARPAPLKPLNRSTECRYAASTARPICAS